MFRRPTTALCAQLLSTTNLRHGFSIHNRPPQLRLFPNTNNAIAPRRSLHTALWPPVVFAQLVLVLWAYKCFMMIIFQNKLIYLPYIPYGARQETIQDYKPQLCGIDWSTVEVRTRDRQVLTACVTEIRKKIDAPEVVIVYFQGNASSMPSRLPYLSRIFQKLSHSKELEDANICIVAPSYRGYWTSTGRPSQSGLEQDALATLEWIQNRYSGREVNIVLYGHSIGAGVACYAGAKYKCAPNLRICGLILETPFTSVSEMLVTLYPQKWLPYRYLSPFLRSSWNIKEYLSEISREKELPRVMIVQAGQDEIVENWMAPEIQDFATQNGLNVDFFSAKGALHFECMASKEFSGWVSGFVAKCLKDQRSR